MSLKISFSLKFFLFTLEKTLVIYIESENFQDFIMKIVKYEVL